MLDLLAIWADAHRERSTAVSFTEPDAVARVFQKPTASNGLTPVCPTGAATVRGRVFFNMALRSVWFLGRLQVVG